jgi:hypothetical protein
MNVQVGLTSPGLIGVDVSLESSQDFFSAFPTEVVVQGANTKIGVLLIFLSWHLIPLFSQVSDLLECRPFASCLGTPLDPEASSFCGNEVCVPKRDLVPRWRSIPISFDPPHFAVHLRCLESPYSQVATVRQF